MTRSLSEMSAAPGSDTQAAPRQPRATVTVRDHRHARLFWWKEALIAGVFYFVYSLIRNQFGSNRMADGAPPYQAFHNAEKIIYLERLLGIFHEETIQELFLHSRGLIRAMNVYYGTAHFVVTIAVFVLLFWKRPGVFAQWRNTLAVMTGLAIAGFALFPLMPPRLLDVSCDNFGGECIASRFRPPGGSFGFVDTLARYGGLWSFGSGGMANVSNQYAAMPSLHIGWSTWCAVAMWPLLRRRWQRVAVLLYPLVTLFCIVVTGNHFFLDGAGGLLVFGVGLLVGWGMHRLNQERLDRKWERLNGVRGHTLPVPTVAVAAPGDSVWTPATAPGRSPGSPTPP